jgi:hypothetical protein
MKLPEYVEKRKRGPALFLTLATGKYFIDGLIYSLLTAGVFGWLWPR